MSTHKNTLLGHVVFTSTICLNDPAPVYSNEEMSRIIEGIAARIKRLSPRSNFNMVVFDDSGKAMEIVVSTLSNFNMVVFDDNGKAMGVVGFVHGDDYRSHLINRVILSIAVPNQPFWQNPISEVARLFQSAATKLASGKSASWLYDGHAFRMGRLNWSEVLMPINEYNTALCLRGEVASNHVYNLSPPGKEPEYVVLNQDNGLSGIGYHGPAWRINLALGAVSNQPIYLAGRVLQELTTKEYGLLDVALAKIKTVGASHVKSRCTHDDESTPIWANNVYSFTEQEYAEFKAFMAKQKEAELRRDTGHGFAVPESLRLVLVKHNLVAS